MSNGWLCTDRDHPSRLLLFLSFEIDLKLRDAIGQYRLVDDVVPAEHVHILPAEQLHRGHRVHAGEIDRLWDALKEGGSVEQCGWLRDRWGLCWQITPKRLGELMNDPDTAKAKRVAEAMLKMVKFDIAKLEAAAKSGSV